MESKDTPDFEIHEEVVAEVVEINQAGAALVKAESVTVTQGGIQSVEAKDVAITQGGAFVVTAEKFKVTRGGAAIVSSQRAKLDHSINAFMVTDTVDARDSVIGLVLAGNIEGSPDVKVDARSAAAFGAGAVVALFILRRIFKRS
jgi:hypothetical protein